MHSLRERIRTQVSELYSLPPLPPIALQVVRTAQDPEASAQDLGELIQQDASLTARVLRVANSSLFALRTPVVSVERAVVVLGAQMVSSIVVGESLNKEFRGILERQTMTAFWQHCWSAAAAAQELSAHVRWAKRGVLLTVGLLHDIGVLALLVLAGDEMEQASRLAVEEGMDPLEAELEVLGTTHSEVGGWLAEGWRLPEVIGAVARYHRGPSLAPEDHQPLAAAAYIADTVAIRAGACRIDGASYPPFDDAVLRQLLPTGPPLSWEVVEGLVNTVHERQEGIARLIQGSY